MDEVTLKRNIHFKISPFPSKFPPTVWKQFVAWVVFSVALWWHWIKTEEVELVKFDDVKFVSLLHKPPVQEIPASFRPGQPHKKTWAFFFLFPIPCMSVQELYSAVHNLLASQLIPVTRMVACWFHQWRYRWDICGQLFTDSHSSFGV